MSVLDGAKIVSLVAVAALVQVSWLNGMTILGGAPDVLLVTVIAVGLLRGSIAGAAAGFGGGLLADASTLGVVGVSALVLTLAGYWAGRYAETTGRDQSQAAVLAILATTFAAGVAASFVHFLLGEEVFASAVFSIAVWPALLLNLVVGVPVYLFCRRILRSSRTAPGGADRIGIPSGGETFS